LAEWFGQSVGEMRERIVLLGQQLLDPGHISTPSKYFYPFFRGPSLVRVSSEEMEGTGSVGVCGPSSRSISPTFSNESLG